MDAALLFGDDPYRYPGQPADRRRQGRTRRQARLRVAARRRQELPGALTGHQHRLGHRAGRPAQPRDRAPRSGPTTFPVTRADARAAEHPLPRRARRPARFPYPGAPPYGAPLYAPGRHAAVPGPAAGAATGAPREPGRRRRARSRSSCQRRRLQPTPPPPLPSQRPHRHDRRQTVRHTARKDSRERELRGALWRLAIFVVVCLLGTFALIAVFAQLRFEASRTTTAPCSATSVAWRAATSSASPASRSARSRTSPSTPTPRASVEFSRRRLGGAHRGQQGAIRYDNLIGGRYLALEEGAGGTTTAAPRRHHPAGPHRARAGPRRADRRLPAAVPRAGPRQVNALTGQLIAAFRVRAPRSVRF